MRLILDWSLWASLLAGMLAAYMIYCSAARLWRNRTHEPAKAKMLVGHVDGDDDGEVRDELLARIDPLIGGAIEIVPVDDCPAHSSMSDALRDAHRTMRHHAAPIMLWGNMTPNGLDLRMAVSVTRDGGIFAQNMAMWGAQNVLVPGMAPVVAARLLALALPFAPGRQREIVRTGRQLVSELERSTKIAPALIGVTGLCAAAALRLCLASTRTRPSARAVRRAIKVYRQAYRQLAEGGDARTRGEILTGLAEALMALGIISQKSPPLHEALETAAEATTAVTGPEAALLLFATRCRQGEIHEELGRRTGQPSHFDESIACYREVLPVVAADTVPGLRALILNDLAGVLRLRAKHEVGTASLDEAVIALDEAIAAAETLEPPWMSPALLFNKAGALQSVAEWRGDPDPADAAARLYAQASALVANMGGNPEPYDHGRFTAEELAFTLREDQTFPSAP